MENYKTLNNIAKKAACTTALLLAMASFGANANPILGGNAPQGVTVTTDGNTLNINQTKSRSEINWLDFSNNANEIINFNLPSKDAVSINRVTGGRASTIMGQLNSYANGQYGGNVVLINPNGITFTSTAKVNVGSLIATTAKDYNFDTVKNELVLNNATKAIRNDGEINLHNAGTNAYLVFVAPEIINTGKIDTSKAISLNTPLVGLHAVKGVTLKFAGNDTIGYKLAGYTTINDGTLAKTSVTNTGQIIANSGLVQITAQQARDAKNSVINLDGVIDVSSLTANNKTYQAGVISVGNEYNDEYKFDSNGNRKYTPGSEAAKSNATINVKGKLLANTTNTANGGNVSLSTNGSINTFANSQISANAKTNGGSVKILRNSSMNVDGKITANGLETGKGGLVDISAIGNVNVKKTAVIEANGYSDGGTINIASSSALSMQGTSVSNGQTGFGGYVGVSGVKGTNLKSTSSVKADGAKGLGYIELGTLTDYYAAGSDLVSAGPLNISGVVSANSLINGNAGVINAQTDGKLVIAKTAQLQVNGSGTGNGGSVYIQSNSEAIVNAGKIYADASSNGKGGTVTLRAKKSLTVGATGLLEAKGGANQGNGGQIALASDEAGVVNYGDINASAANNGSGGQIAILGATLTNKAGQTTYLATGGATGGNGGTVNFSVDKVKGYKTNMSDVSAPAGSAGTVTLP